MTKDALGITVVVLLYAGLIAGLWLGRRRERIGIRREKMTGRLPARRSPRPPSSMSPVLMATVVLLGAFAPIVIWASAVALLPLLTPPSAREFLVPPPTFAQAVRGTLLLWLFCAGMAVFARVAGWLGDRFGRWLDDPAVSRAEELMRAGEFDEAVRVVREAIDARGPTVARWNVLAEILMAQERWAEALAVSLDIEDRTSFAHENRRRKALALFKLGRPEVACSEFRPSGSKPAQRLAEVCAYCQALIDVGLFDRAWDQLRRAEVRYGRLAIADANRPGHRKQIDACRTRLAEHFADEKPDRLDEL